MSKPRIASTAAVQFVYDDPRAAITRPDQFASLSHYFIANWLPGISPNGLKILMRLRSLGYYQPKTGIQRGDIDIDQPQLAEQCGMGLRTLQRIFSDDAILAKYVQRVFQVERDRYGRIIREHYVYVVKMDDILTEEDEAKLLYGLDKTPSRQNDASVKEPTRQNGGLDCQNGTPTCQNGASARQNGGSYKESLTLLTEGNTSDTPGAAPELTASLFPEKTPEGTDVLGMLSSDQWTALEAAARTEMLATVGEPIRTLVRQGKAMRDVKIMMRLMLKRREH